VTGQVVVIIILKAVLIGKNDVRITEIDALWFVVKLHRGVFTDSEGK
jgi:hypothetical protein